jgi:hypothetical protein
MKAEEILANRNMFAGKIMQKLTHDELKAAVDELMGAIEIRGGKLEKPITLLCKEAMSKALKKIYPTLECVDDDDIGMVDQDSAEEILCIVTKDEKFPEHYIVLSDLHNMYEHLAGNLSSPQSALLAVKGFKTEKEKFVIYEADNFESIVWDIIGQIAEMEFKEREHDSLKSIVVYSDFMMYSLIQLGFVSGEVPLFLGKVMVKLEHQAEKKSRITLVFKSGTSITMMTKEEAARDQTVEEEPDAYMKGDMMGAVLEGMFGK